MTETQTVAGTFESIKDNYDPAQGAGTTAKFQFDISGDGGGQWYADLNDGEATIAEGTLDDPTVTIMAADEDWVKIASGELNPQMAFMTGKVKVKGDVGLATKLSKLFL